MSDGSPAAAKTIVLAVLIFVDLVLFLVPFLMTRSRKKKMREYTLTAEATVIDMTSERHRVTHSGGHSRTAPMWFPTYQYTVNGQTFTHHSHVGTSEKHFEIGDRMKILVDPDNYEKYILADSPAFRLATGILWAIFAFFFIATVIAGIVL